jgi:L-aminopeptidase/D-esterase-like protein
MAHDGIAQVVRPAHTMFDGDTVFALALGPGLREKPHITGALQTSMIGATAANTLARAIVKAVRNATT